MAKESVQEQWRERLADFNASGQTQTQWCRENGLPLHRLTYWRSRLGERTGSVQSAGANGHGTTWCAVRTPDAAAHAAALTVRAGGASIEVTAGFDAALLRAVVQALQVGDATC